MKLKFKKLLSSPPKTLALGFLLLIVLGTILLSLPIAYHKPGEKILLDAFFTSTSAVCVTGLSVQNTALHWTGFGKAVILMLIQIGGIGFMTIATSFFVFAGKKVSLRERLIIKEQFNTNQKSGIVRLTNSVIKYTFTIESMGALLLALYFVPKFGFRTGVIYSIFHAISAFCNAGFDLFGNSLVDYYNVPWVVYVIAGLIILGGLGFTVLNDLAKRRSYRKKSTHTRLVLRTNLILLIIGFLSFFILEYSNGATIKHMSLFDKINAAIFQSVSPRTAGFQTVNYSLVKDSTLLITILLMFIGASPGGTGGGIKTSTVGAVIASVISVVKGNDDIDMFGRRIDPRTVKKALAILVVAMFLILGASFALTVIHPNIRFIDILFEVTSAFGTVGLGVGVTDNIGVFGKLLICGMMYIGRVGPLTIIYTIRIKHKNNNIRLAPDDILVG